MPDPLISVVTTAYNRAHTIGSTISSVQAQTLTDFEHVIATDAGSSDDTAATVDRLAAGDDRIRVVHHAHTNQPGGLNIGLEGARGTYVCFIDSDDVMLPRYLQLMTAPWKDDPELGFAYTDAWSMDDATKRVRRRTFLDLYEPRDLPLGTAEQLLTALIDLNFISEESTARRDVIEAVGGFDETMSHSTDYDLWVRVLARGFRGIRAPGPPLLLHRDSSDSLSKNTAALWECNRKIMGKLADELPVSDQIKRLARGRIEELDAGLERLGHPSRGQRLVASVRRPAGRARRLLLDRRRHLKAPPAEIQAAFPDLERV
jgi:glycosyltransferase involved in cell wall biosynthesis